jgi:hypothetical protein
MTGICAMLSSLPARICVMENSIQLETQRPREAREFGEIRLIRFFSGEPTFLEWYDISGAPGAEQKTLRRFAASPPQLRDRESYVPCLPDRAKPSRHGTL